jgi:hypothetical protein
MAGCGFNEAAQRARPQPKEWNHGCTPIDTDKDRLPMRGRVLATQAIEDWQGLGAAKPQPKEFYRSKRRKRRAGKILPKMRNSWE